jgi:hypothetical protein
MSTTIEHEEAQARVYVIPTIGARKHNLVERTKGRGRG